VIGSRSQAIEEKPFYSSRFRYPSGLMVNTSMIFVTIKQQLSNMQDATGGGTHLPTSRHKPGAPESLFV
jgi:hypothetical protein